LDEDAQQTDGPATLAEASRRRRDLVSGEVMDEHRLIRFVIAPDGRAIPDLGRKLPGRGLWVEASKAAIDQAVQRGAFSRGAKRKVKAEAGLSDEVETLLTARLLAGLGLARRGGYLVTGFDKVEAAIRSGRLALWIEACDGAADGRRKLDHAAHAAEKNLGRRPKFAAIFNSAEMNLALGLENVIHLGLLAGPRAERWAQDLAKLAGFRPLIPPSWSTAE
jgi:hypothetical protein